ncbi:TPA: NAD(P)H oxidoreductase, partial [Haemophilus influenzae]
NYCGIENVEFELFGDIHLIDDKARKAMIELAAQKTQEKLTALLKEKA